MTRAQRDTELTPVERKFPTLFELGTDAAMVLYPNRYMDARGQVMWERVTKLLLSPDHGLAQKTA